MAQANVGTLERVVFVLVSTGIGGAEKQAVLLSKQLQNRRDYEVAVVCIGAAPGLLTQHLNRAGIKNYFVDCLFPDSKVKTAFGFVKLLLLLRRLKPTVLMPYTYVPNMMVSLIWRLTQAKIAIWNQRDEGLGVLPGKLNTLAIRNASGFIANSKGGKTFLEHTFKVKEPIHVIANAIAEPNEEFLRARLTRHLATDREIVLTMVANLSRNKDHRTVFYAVRGLIQKFDGRVKLMLAGRWDDQYANLVSLANELGIAQAINFLGEVDDVPGLLAETDIALLSSYSEGFSNVVLEAMNLGVPIVASDISGVREVIGDDYTYLFEPGNHEDLCNKAYALSVSESEQKKVIARNIERVKVRFSVQKLEADTIGVLDQLIKRG